MAILAALSAGQPTLSVNVPYPLSPDEAARDFLRAVDELSPRAWTRGYTSGIGSFLACGVLHGKTRASNGATVFMLRLPSDEIALVRCDSALPELALDQRVYMIVDFSGPDGPAVAQLKGVVLACDVGEKCQKLDALLGLSQPVARPPSVQAPETAQPATQTVQFAQAVQPAAGSSGHAALLSQAGTVGQPFVLPAQPSVLKPLDPVELPPVDAVPRPPSVIQPSVQGYLPISDSESLQAAEEPLVEFWKDWIASHNRHRTEAEREAIVRWVLYYSDYYGIDHRLVFAVMKCESNFDLDCVSHAGAIGLMQLMPGTAKGLGVDPWVVEENIKGGVQELAGYLDQYSGRDNFDQCALALACYNAGPNRVKRAGGIPNITETKNYVRRVTDLFSELVKQGAP